MRKKVEEQPLFGYRLVKRKIPAGVLPTIVVLLIAFIFFVCSIHH